MELTVLQKKMINLLNDTVKYYSEDVTRRNILGDTCYYHPLNENTKGCAIGRLIPKTIAKKWDKFEVTGISWILSTQKRPKKIELYPVYFLKDLQDLHDGNFNWDSTGLSEEGFFLVSLIKNRIEKDFYEHKYVVI